MTTKNAMFSTRSTHVTNPRNNIGELQLIAVATKKLALRPSNATMIGVRWTGWRVVTHLYISTGIASAATTNDGRMLNRPPIPTCSASKNVDTNSTVTSFASDRAVVKPRTGIRPRLGSTFKWFVDIGWVKARQTMPRKHGSKANLDAYSLAAE